MSQIEKVKIRNPLGNIKIINGLNGLKRFKL